MKETLTAHRRRVPGVRVFVVAAIAAAVVASAIPALRSSNALGATAACTPEAAWPANNASLESQVVALVNQRRASLGLAALAVDATLSDAAVWKARHMAQYQYFGHDDPAPPAGRTRVHAQPGVRVLLERGLGREHRLRPGLSG